MIFPGLRPHMNKREWLFGFPPEPRYELQNISMLSKELLGPANCSIPPAWVTLWWSEKTKPRDLVILDANKNHPACTTVHGWAGKTPDQLPYCCFVLRPIYGLWNMEEYRDRADNAGTNKYYTKYPTIIPAFWITIAHDAVRRSDMVCSMRNGVHIIDKSGTIPNGVGNPYSEYVVLRPSSYQYAEHHVKSIPNFEGALCANG